MSADPAGGHLLEPLAEGPARLDRSDVVASQRRRMIAAMIKAVARKGYANVSVSDVVSGARVSRATFYEQFTDKTDCYVACYEACVADLNRVIERDVAPKLTPRDRLRGFLECWLGYLADSPDTNRVLLVDIYAASADVVAARVKYQHDHSAPFFRGVHQDLRRDGEAVLDLTDFDFEVLVAGLGGLVTNRVACGESDGLRALVVPLERYVLHCFGLDS